MEKTALQHRSTYVFRSGICQDEIVCRCLRDEPDRMHEAQASMVDQPNYRIFCENPLQLGFYLFSRNGNGF